MASEKRGVSPEQQKNTQAQQGQPGGAPAEQKGREGREEHRTESGLSRRESRAPAVRASDLWMMSPFSLMHRMMSEFDRMFEELGFGMGAVSPRGDEPRGEALARGALWSPQVDVLEREGNLVVRADLPGLTKDDIRVEVMDDMLVIEGERRREHTEEGAGFYRAERSHGSFRRAIPLPEGASAESADARFDNGVLEISLPMPKERSRGKRIEIHEGEGKSVH